MTNIEIEKIPLIQIEVNYNSELPIPVHVTSLLIARVESEAASQLISPAMRRRLQSQVLTIKLPSPGGGQRLKRLGGPGFDFAPVIDKVTARNLVKVNGQFSQSYHRMMGWDRKSIANS